MGDGGEFLDDVFPFEGQMDLVHHMEEVVGLPHGKVVDVLKDKIQKVAALHFHFFVEVLSSNEVLVYVSKRGGFVFFELRFQAHPNFFHFFKELPFFMEDKSAEDFLQWYLNADKSDRDEVLFGIAKPEDPKREFFDVCEQCGENDPSSRIVVDYSSGSYYCINCGLEKQCPLLEDREWFEEEEDKHHAPMRNKYLQRHHFSERINAFLCNDPELPWGLSYIIKDEIATMDPEFEILKNAEKAKDIVRRAIQRLVKRGEKHAKNTMQEKWILVRYEATGLKPEAPWNFAQEMLQKFNYFINAWSRNKPLHRKNILHLNSVIRELIGQCFGQEYMRECFPYFPLLKNKKKVQQVEQLLKEVCDSLRWTYISIQ